MRRVAFVSVVLAVAGAGVALLTRIVIVPWLESVPGWVIPTDAWTPLRAARSVANLDVFHLYEPLAGRTGYPYTPGLPVLLAPVPWIGDKFHLLGDPIYRQARPGMFWLLGPAEAIAGLLPVLWVAGRATSGRADIVKVQCCVFLVAAWAPVVWFHPEDTIAIALCIAAALWVRDERYRRAGVCVAAAILFKQWAIFPALPVVAAAPRGKRGLVSFYAFALPAIVMVPFLLASASTWTSLTGTLASLQYGQPQLWLSHVFGHQYYADPKWLHVSWGLASLAIAWWIRVRPTTDRVLAAIGLVMLARLPFEPVLFGYYLVPALVVSVIWCARNDEKLVLRTVTGALLCAFCMPHTFPQPVFFAMLCFGLGYVCGPMVLSLRNQQVPADDRPHEEQEPPAEAMAVHGAGDVAQRRL